MDINFYSQKKFPPVDAGPWESTQVLFCISESMGQKFGSYFSYSISKEASRHLEPGPSALVLIATKSHQFERMPYFIFQSPPIKLMTYSNRGDILILEFGPTNHGTFPSPPFFFIPRNEQKFIIPLSQCLNDSYAHALNHFTQYNPSVIVLSSKQIVQGNDTTKYSHQNCLFG